MFIISENDNFCFFFECKTVNINLWNMINVSKVCVFINEFGKFVNIKSIHEGLFEFL